MDPYIWTRKVSTDTCPHCECIAACVDDLLIASKDPEGIAHLLANKHKFKLKGTGPIKYHLGCDFDRDNLHTLCFAPRKCIEKMADAYYTAVGTKPKPSVILFWNKDIT